MRKTSETKTTTITINNEGILYLTAKPGEKIDGEEAKNICNAVKEITKGEKVLEVLVGFNFSTANNAALKYASEHGKESYIASAMIVNSISTKILFNFFKNFFKYEVPFKLFTKEKDALNWLRKFSNKK